MVVDLLRIYQIADSCTPQQIQTVYVRRGGKDQKRSNDPDTVFDYVNPQHAIHGTGFPVQIEIIFYAIIKTLSALYDRDPQDKYDRWPVITLEDFMLATQNWVRRSQLIGDDLDYWFKVLRDLGYLRVSSHDGTVFLALTTKGVQLILTTIGFKVEPEMISYSCFC